MSTTLLRTKYTLPPLRSSLITRPRLVEKLDRARLRPLTLVTAAAGFGKTTLVREWCAQQTTSCAWFSLDADDNDPARFLAYLLAALQVLNPTVGENLDAQLQAPSISPEAILANLINELSAHATEIFLVLDDYHWIENELLNTALEFFIEHLPANAHVLVTTRVDPPWALARWRARNQLNELRASDLRWTTSEAAQFFSDAMDLQLTDAQIETLQTRTEGWIAGLQLAALALAERANVQEFIESFSGNQRYIITYLAEEVLKRQSAELETFLVQTAVLERFNAELCRALTDSADAQTQLNELSERNLFLIPLDEQGEWYRYHFLFAQVLRARLKQKYGAQKILELHETASEWFEQNHFINEAIQHALDARAWERAARLIQTYAPDFWRRGEMPTLERWLNTIPRGVAQADARFLLAEAMTLVLTAPAQIACIDELIARAEKLPAPNGVDANALRAQLLAVAGANSSNQSDAARTIDLTQRALQELAPAQLFWRTLTQVNLGIAYIMDGSPRLAIGALETGIELARSSELLYLGFFGRMHLTHARMMRGQLRAARAIFSNALADLDAHHLEGSPVAGYLYGGYGKLLYEWNELSESRVMLERARERIEAQTRPWALAEIEMDLARVALAEHNAAKAQTILAHAAELVRDERLAWLRPLFAAMQARADLRLGKVARAAEWMQQAKLSAHDEISFLREYEYLTLARVLSAQGETKPALELVQRIQTAARVKERHGVLLEAEILCALACTRTNNRTLAYTHLHRALQMARAENVVRVFVDEGEPMRRLLGDWKLEIRDWRLEIGDLDLQSYVEKLLAAFGQEIRASIVQSKIENLSRTQLRDQKLVPNEAEGSKILFESLSERELQVLRLIASGASNQEIADKLVIALPTVKRHISNIYAKLEVTSRTQALVRARELKLI